MRRATDQLYYRIYLPSGEIMGALPSYIHATYPSPRDMWMKFVDGSDVACIGW